MSRADYMKKYRARKRLVSEQKQTKAQTAFSDLPDGSGVVQRIMNGYYDGESLDRALDRNVACYDGRTMLAGPTIGPVFFDGIAVFNRVVRAETDRYLAGEA